MLHMLLNSYLSGFYTQKLPLLISIDFLLFACANNVKLFHPVAGARLWVLCKYIFFVLTYISDVTVAKNLGAVGQLIFICFCILLTPQVDI